MAGMPSMLLLCHPNSADLVPKADEVKDYIKWAVEHSFGVIDVNIPEVITTEAGDQPSSYIKPNNAEAQKQAEKLAGYLWENYIEPSEVEHLYFMGVGNAFHGIVKLLCDRGKQPMQPHSTLLMEYRCMLESVQQRVAGVIVFIADNPVRPVHSNENPSLSRWYSQNSKVFVAHQHSLWSKTDRRMSRRYGAVEQSPGTKLNEMLILHRHQVFAWVAERTELDDAVSEEEPQTTEDLVMSLEKPDVQNWLTDRRE
jgi:histone deacetylase 6